MVELGRAVPSWGLCRWGGSGLRFVPPDDEGFTLRGDKHRLVYRGRRRSHRFTILGDTAFEYDCILEKEPESNVITLLMEGAEQFDFFKQPDFVREPLLAGSYAVYKKETRAGEGTGKLCHIHRPEIIDSQGRRCWGDLSVIGNELRITIPEDFLSEAKYPVIVDPTIGSSSAGAYHSFYYIHDSEYEECLEGWEDEGATAAQIAEYLEDWKIMPTAHNELLFNRWTNSEPVQGLCNVFFHVAEINYGNYNVFVPVLFNEAGNIPDIRISSKEYGWLGTRGVSPLGWNTVTFQVQNTVAANSPLWLGSMASGMGISFDYGADFFDIAEGISTAAVKTAITNGQPVEDLLIHCGQSIPTYWEGWGDEWLEEIRPALAYQKHNAHPKRPGRYDFKFSYYFQPVSTAYTRSITAGVTLTDKGKPAGGYKRTMVQTAGGTGVLKRAPVFMRKAVEGLAAITGISNKRDIHRVMPDRAAVESGMSRRGDGRRVISNTAAPGAGLQRYAGIHRKLASTGGVYSGLLCLLTLPRRIVEMAGATEGVRVIREMLRRITVQAGNAGGVKPAAGYRRDITSAVNAATHTTRYPVFLRRILNTLTAGEYAAYSAVWLRHLAEEGTATDKNRHIGGYIRGLYTAAGALAETGHRGEYYRKRTDTVNGQGITLRRLGIFIRLIAESGIRDYILGRFLKSREVVVIKSPVCREITLESRL
jgi:hypothetical protein